MTSNKTGRNRLDKYYHLAKEQGYRARSAYKLIQLNKKYNFLNKTNSVIDLCAAPGGWLQVLKQELSHVRIANITEFRQQNLIIGVDLMPIQAIPGVIILEDDITTESCYNQLRNVLETNQIEKIDTVLNDGAPNVGTNWEHDAYVQNELTLHAVKLAYNFLKKGGSFITKIFRSTHYFDLLFVLNKLFDEVKVTKPLSSRIESAEIFAVCMKFKGEVVSPDFFNPEIVFNVSEKTVKKECILLSQILKLNKSQFSSIFKDYRSIEVDLETDIFDKHDLLDIKDLQQINKIECKKLIKKFRNLQKLTVSISKDTLTEDDETEQTETQKKINKIKREMKKLAREEQKVKEYKLLQIARVRGLESSKKTKEKTGSAFFNDSLFQDKNLDKDITDDDIVSSDEESFSLESDEKAMVVNMKKNPEKFMDRTIHRFVHDEHENLPDFYLEEEEEFYKQQVLEDDFDGDERKLIKNKQNQYKNRKALRAEVHQKKLIEENKKVEEVHSDVKVFKKTNNKKRKPKVVIKARKGRTITMRKNIKLVDRRMKKDLRSENRKKRRGVKGKR
ncbi:pre-rRNA processing protein FTSJ3 [Cucumispora dikerogammari]|nr:pre-rRNA processing protein FTSJ3 [Cucumispora dikerogammari]